MKNTDQLKRELALLSLAQQLRIDNGILRKQRDEWKAEAQKKTHTD